MKNLTLSRTLCIRLPHFYAFSRNFRFPDSHTIPLITSGQINLLNLTLPHFSPNPFCPCLLPQIRRRCRFLSKQEPPCLPILAIDPQPTTWAVPPAPLDQIRRRCWYTSKQDPLWLPIHALSVVPRPTISAASRPLDQVNILARIRG